MHVDAVRLTPKNLACCAPLWGGRETYVGDELERVLSGAALLLSEGRARGAIVVEDGCPRAFGITTFADEGVVMQYLDAVQPHIGKQLLLGAHDPASTDVLRLPQIAERNAGTGLQLVVANAQYDVSARQPDTVLGCLMAAFFETHRGFRIARIVTEVFGDAAMSVVEDSRASEIVSVFDLPVSGATLKSLVGTLTREQAAAWKSPLLAMFAYSPPRLFFTTAEQTLLGEALAGFTDETLSGRLAIPLSAVKARWSRIQDRLPRTAPELFDQRRACGPGPAGPQRISDSPPHLPAVPCVIIRRSSRRTRAARFPSAGRHPLPAAAR